MGVKDASKHGVGGIILGEGKRCTPTVFRYEWPPDIKASLVSFDNPHGTITNSDLEMAGLLMLYLVMEVVCPLTSGAHVALFSDNQPTVSWVKRLAARSSLVAAQLLRALVLRMKKRGSSPLTPLHIPGSENQMTDIPSRSFGSERKWHCREDSDLLTLFNEKFPLPKQASWTVFRPTKEICMKILSVLRMRVTTMEGWTQPPRIGKHIGRIGAPMSNLWEWSLRAFVTGYPICAPSPCNHGICSNAANWILWSQKTSPSCNSLLRYHGHWPEDRCGASNKSHQDASVG